MLSDIKTRLGNMRRTVRDMQARHQMYRAPAPLIIGGVGGSGTRLFVDFFKSAGMFMGSRLDEHNDARSLIPYMKGWIPTYLGHNRQLTPLLMKRFVHDAELSFIRHRDYMPDPMMPWGVKEPPLILLLPLIIQMFPQMKFLHIVRDGRDMAFSDNQRQTLLFAPYLSDKRLWDAPLPVRSIAYWSLVNCETRKFGDDVMKDRYLMMRFEDACNNPRTVLKQVFDFVGLPNGDLDAAAAAIKIPESIGRWKSHDPQMIEAVLREGTAGLAEFGYTDLS
jgi:hypothetical protein